MKRDTPDKFSVETITGRARSFLSAFEILARWVVLLAALYCVLQNIFMVSYVSVSLDDGPRTEPPPLGQFVQVEGGPFALVFAAAKTSFNRNILRPTLKFLLAVADEPDI